MSNETLKLIDNKQTTIDALIPNFLERVHRPSFNEDVETTADYFVSDIINEIFEPRKVEALKDLTEAWIEVRNRFLIALEN